MQRNIKVDFEEKKKVKNLIFIHTDTLQNLAEQCPKDEDGWIKRSCLISKIQEEIKCSIPTAYRIIKTNSGIFEFNHAWLKTIVSDKIEIKPEVEVTKWLEERNNLLNKIVGLLKNKPTSPRIDDILMMIGRIRNDLKSGLDDKFPDLKVTLQQEFGIDMEEILENEESESVPETEAVSTENPVK